MDNRLNVMIVDDEELNIMILEELVSSQNHKVTAFENPLDALDYVKSNEPDIVLIDYMMPEMDGIELTKHIKVQYPDMIVVMITAAGEQKDLKIQALEAGVTDFLLKPIETIEVQLRLRNLAELRYSKKIMKKYNKNLEEDVRKATEQILEGYHEALQIISNAAEYRDPETSNHINRVAHYSKLIGEKLGLSSEEQEIIFYASPLHDVGKIAIPDAILLKPGKLTDEEFDIMRTHSLSGFEILKDAKNPYLKAGAEIALSHHERYDGNGYPNKVRGEDIHLYSRVTAVADVFDALTSSRPYKEAWPFEKAIQLIESEKGGHFDPVIVSLFVENIDQIQEIFNHFNN